MENQENVEAFVGSRAGYYRQRWRSFSEAPSAMLSFNLAACLGQVLWLAYRKLYPALLWFMAALVADVCLVLYVEEHRLLPAGIVTAWNTIMAVLFMAVPGFWGNSWYWRRFRKVELQAASGQGGRDEQLRFLRRRGGTSPFGAALLAALFAAPVLWVGYQASLYRDLGYVFDATGPLTLAEVEANLWSRMDLELSGEQRECVLREIEERAEAAGDPEKLDPATVELLPEESWTSVDPFGRRLLLAQVISTGAIFACP